MLGGRGSGILSGSTIFGGGTNRVLYENASGVLATTANFTFDGFNLSVGGAGGGTIYGQSFAGSGGAFGIDNAGNLTATTFQTTSGSLFQVFNNGNIQASDIRTRTAIYADQINANSSGTEAIDVFNCDLIAQGGGSNLNWSVSGEIDISAAVFVSNSFYLNSLFDYSNQALAFDIISRVLYDSSSQFSIDLANRVCLDGGSTLSIDYGNRYLEVGGSAAASVNWGSGLLLNPWGTGHTSLDWQNYELFDLNAVISMNWNTRIQGDSSGVSAHDWQNRILYDGSNFAAIIYRLRQLTDHSSVVAVDWDNRLLKDTAAATQLSWSTSGVQVNKIFSSYNGDTTVSNGVASIVGSISRTAQTASITSTAFFTPINGAEYLISILLYDSVAGVSGNVTATINWNDGIAARTYTTSSIAFGALNQPIAIVFPILTNASGITFSTTVTAAVGSPQYGLKLKAVRTA